MQIRIEATVTFVLDQDELTLLQHVLESAWRGYASADEPSGAGIFCEDLRAKVAEIKKNLPRLR